MSDGQRDVSPPAEETQQSTVYQNPLAVINDDIERNDNPLINAVVHYLHEDEPLELSSSEDEIIRNYIPPRGDSNVGSRPRTQSSSSSDRSWARNEDSLSSDSTGSESDISFNMAPSEAEKQAIDSQPTPEFLLRPPPKHKWFLNRELILREYGSSNRYQAAKKFQNGMYGSLHAVQRLELMYKLEQHNGCVNSVSFNQTGQLLASCSDDLTVCLWDWPIGRLIKQYQANHKSNVFQCKFLPLQGHIFIATSARDGVVRLLEIASDGSLVINRRLARHNRVCHKLALIPDSPHVFLSCGEDGLVYSVDVRESTYTGLLTVLKEKRKMRIPLYTIACHPLDSNEFMVGGDDQFVRLYDRRQLKAPTLMLSPKHVANQRGYSFAKVTCAVYNYNGSEMLASLNDEDIYLWDRNTPDDYIHRYQGHRNSATIKGVNFFGPRSEFVVSGSDCGNIYFWERESEAIVQWMAGDESGVVNCLEPHPHVPILATSGFDHDVKIWVPSCETVPSLEGLKSTVTINIMRRQEAVNEMQDDNSGAPALWVLWRHINRAIEGRSSGAQASGNERADGGNDEDENDARPAGCSQS